MRRLSALFLIAALVFGCGSAHASISFQPVPVANLSDGILAHPIDMDTDGDTDVIAITESGATMWYERIESGAFLLHTLSTEPAFDAWPFDLDEDGDMDYIWCLQSGEVIARMNNGLQEFSSDTLGTQLSPICPRVANLDDDPELEIAVGSEDYWYGEVAIFDPVAPGEYTVTMLTGMNGPEPELADMDGDGDLDIVCAGGSYSTGVYTNEGNLQFTIQYIDGGGDGLIGVADLDADGDNDIVVATSWEDRVLIHTNNGNGYTTETLTDIPGEPYGIRVGDIDGDGRVDFVVWGYISVAWMRNRGNMQFDRLPVGGDERVDHIELADFDHDCRLDIASISEYSNEIIFWNNIEQFGFETVTVDGSINYPFHADFADFNNDGITDIVASSYTGGYFRLYENDGTQHFTEHDVSGFDYAADVVAGDFDGDGDMDFAGTTSDPDAVVWFEQAAPWAFATHYIYTSYPYGGMVGFMKKVDWEGDGDLDLVATNSNSDRVFLFRNDGSGTFTTTIVGALVEAYSIDPVDLDQDGDMDLLVGQLDPAGAISWYENNGDETFTLNVLVSSNGYSCSALDGLDLEGDGDIDIVATTVNGILAFWNDGGSFSETTVDLQYDWRDHSIADVNLDGLPDIYASADGGNIAVWLEQLPGGGWERHTIATGLDYPYHCDAGDIDNDGDMDLMTANYYGHTYTLFINEPHIGLDQVTFSLAPNNAPIVVPPSGGQFSYAACIEHSAPSGSTIRVNTSVKAPNGFTYPFNSRSIYVPEEGLLATDVPLTLPSGLPQGVYEYIVTLRLYSITLARDSFYFQRTNTAAGFGTEIAETFAPLEAPTSFGLSTAYPNPFNPTTTMAVSLPTAAELQVDVYNVTGQRVASLADGTYPAGTHSLTFDASSLASGLYFVRASVPGKLNQVRKVILVR
ncbi:T9SS type A sorting domain-containing protein [bacterium]|nr:T9SS type A sorting domain-containing protein [bacterium]